MARSPPTATTPLHDSSLVQSGSPWTRRTEIGEEALLDTLWRSRCRYLPPTACDTTHSRLRCRMYRKLSFHWGCPLLLHSAHLQPLVTPMPVSSEHPWPLHAIYFFISRIVLPSVSLPMGLLRACSWPAVPLSLSFSSFLRCLRVSEPSTPYPSASPSEARGRAIFMLMLHEATMQWLT